MTVSKTVKQFLVLALFLIGGLMVTQSAALADEIYIQGTTYGYFNENPGMDELMALKFHQGAFSGIADGEMTLGNLGYFNVGSISDSDAERYDGEEFTLRLVFQVPNITTPGGNPTPFDASLEGTTHWYGPETVTFTFGPGKTLAYTNEAGYGTFEVAVNDLMITEGTTNNYLTGEISDVNFTAYVPEPASIILLGSMLLGLGIWRKRRA